jgi:hypothetical protein
MKVTMRTLMILLTAVLSLPALAQSQARPRPKDVQVVEDLVTPPQVKEGKKVPEPEIVTRKAGSDTIHEYRISGRLYQQKVQPAKGPAYYLIDEKGEGKFTRVDGPEPKIAVPMWVLLEW